MKYGFTLPGSGPLTGPENMSAIARRGEELGYDFLMVPDHIVFPRQDESVYPYNEQGVHPGVSAGACLEQLTVLAFLAGQTKRIRLGSSVMIVPHRSPVVTAKALATLDVLSNGRVIVGVGTGWLREEFEILGLPPFEERGAVTDEYIRAFKELWTSDNPTFEGKYCRFSEVSFLPKPVQKPHPPIWVGGESHAAMRRAARMGNGWHPLGANVRFPLGRPEQLAEGIKRLAALAEREGRNPEEIDIAYRVHGNGLTKNANSPAATSPSGDRAPFTGSAEQIAGDIQQYEQMGVNHLALDFGGVASSRQGDAARVMQHLEDLATLVWPLV